MQEDDVRNLLAASGVHKTVMAPVLALSATDSYEDALSILLSNNRFNDYDWEEIADSHYFVVMCRPTTAHTWLTTTTRHFVTSQGNYSKSFLQGTINGLLRAGVDLDTSSMQTDFQKELLEYLTFIVSGISMPRAAFMPSETSGKVPSDFNKKLVPLLESFLFPKESGRIRKGEDKGSIGKEMISSRTEQVKKAVKSLCYPGNETLHETSEMFIDRLVYAIFNKETPLRRLQAIQSITSLL